MYTIIYLGRGETRKGVVSFVGYQWAIEDPHKLEPRPFPPTLSLSPCTLSRGLVLNFRFESRVSG